MAKKRSRTTNNKGSNALSTKTGTDRILDIVMDLHAVDDETTRGGHSSNNEGVVGNSAERNALENTDTDTDGSLSVKDLLRVDDDSNGTADSADGSSTRSKAKGDGHSLNKVTLHHGPSDIRSGITSSDSTFDGIIDDGSSIGRTTSSTTSSAATIKTQTTSSTKETPSILPKPPSSSREHRCTGTRRKVAPFVSSPPPIDGSMQEFAYSTKQQLNHSRKKQFAKQIDKWASDSVEDEESSHQLSTSSRSTPFVPPVPRGTSRRHKVAPKKNNNNSTKRRGIKEDSSTASSQTTDFHDAWMGGKPESSSSTPTTSWVTVIRPIIKLFDGVNLKTIVLCFIGTQMILKMNKTSSPSGAIMTQPHDTAVSASSPPRASHERQLEDASRLTRDLKETSTIVGSTPGLRGAMDIMENNGNGNQNVPENLASVDSSIKSKEEGEEEEVTVDKKRTTDTAVAASSLQDLDSQKQQTLYLPQQSPQDLAVPQPPQQTLGDSQQNPYLRQPTTDLLVAQQQPSSLQVQEPSQQLDLYQQQVQEQGQPLAMQTQQSNTLGQQQVFDPSQQKPQQLINKQTDIGANAQGAVVQQQQYYDPQTQQQIIQPVSSLQQMQQPQQQQVISQQGYAQQPQSIYPVQVAGVYQ